MTAKILIADDHEIVREGIRTLLSRARPEWEICGEARNGKEAVEAVQSLTPDVVVLDITMPVMSGLEAAPRIARLGLHTRVLIFTMHESDRLVTEVRNAGAQGYVVKSQASRDLVLAIDRLLAGGTFFGAKEEQPPRKQEEEKHGITFRHSLASSGI
jgi:DNA-binding NarL/FixJ family response regulator